MPARDGVKPALGGARVSRSGCGGCPATPTNYLIRGLVRESREGHAILAWAAAGEELIAASTAWFEFLCGPVAREHVVTMRAFLVEIVPFGQPHAEEAARLFTAIGRRRSRRVDAMIAATAVVTGARLATDKRDAFEPFVPHGLRLV